MAFQDLTGQKINHWTVLEELGGGKVKCQCDCENKTVKELYKKAVKDGSSKSCGCVKGTIRNNITGQKLNHWTVLKELGGGKVLCQCDCENKTTKEVFKQALQSGRSKSCGCANTFEKKLKPNDKIGEWTIIKQLDVYKCEAVCSCGTHKILYVSNLLRGESKSCGCKKKKENFVGMHFGEWEVLKELGGSKVLCKCSCGVEKEIWKKSLKNGRSKSCGCVMNQNRINTRENKLIGEHFGEWEVLELNNEKVKCKCSCGNIKDVYIRALMTGESRSCGCLQQKLMRETLINMYGDSIPSRAGSPREKWQIDTILSEEKFRAFVSQNFKNKPTIHELAIKLDVSETHIGRLVRNYNLKELINIRPPMSSAEKDIQDYIKSICSYKVIQNYRDEDNKELDIYIPEKKLAIEFNGNYWHSTIFKNKEYHRDKTIKCIKNGIKLLHIFEYEWEKEGKRDILKSMIAENLDCNEQISIEDTSIKELDTQELTDFLDENHMQGHDKYSHNIALVDTNNQVLKAIVYSKIKLDKEDSIEIHRICNKKYTSIIGSNIRLINYIISKHKIKNILAYQDASKYDGTYEDIGFTEIDITAPNYVWNKNRTTLSRNETQKEMLVKNGLGSNDETEDSIMGRLGYYKIYDSGNIRYEYHIKN